MASAATDTPAIQVLTAFRAAAAFHALGASGAGTNAHTTYSSEVGSPVGHLPPRGGSERDRW
jgi:hypothetical protein